jgi:hypothetical protein
VEIVLAALALDGPGGMPTYLLTVAPQLERLGHEVTLYSEKTGPIDIGGMAERTVTGRTRAMSERDSVALRAAQQPAHQQERERRAERDHQRARAPDVVGGDARTLARRRQRELLRGQHVVRLGDPRGIAGEADRAVVEARIASRHAELLGGEHVPR